MLPCCMSLGMHDAYVYVHVPDLHIHNNEYSLTCDMKYHTYMVE